MSFGRFSYYLGSLRVSKVARFVNGVIKMFFCLFLLLSGAIIIACIKLLKF